MSAYLRNISKLANTSEADCVAFLLANLSLPYQTVRNVAQLLVEQMRQIGGSGVFHQFLMRYQLNSPAGLAMMALAESLLRIPDKSTADKLLAEKMDIHVLLAKLGLPIARKGVALMGRQFVMGETIEKALSKRQQGNRYSFDMLGEAAKTAQDAKLYFEAYQHAIHAVGKAGEGLGVIKAPSISVKLSALHPRYEFTQIERLQKELVPQVIELASLAKKYQIGLTIDAEESQRLQLSLLLIEQILSSSELDNWDGFGLAVQAYQKAAPAVMDYCAHLAQKTRHRLNVRLVKGAYWDSEIKMAQVQGYAEYPVYTRKVTTDVAYLYCAKKMLQFKEEIFPQFATHNAFTIAAILEMDKTHEFEFQRLHGMGEPLYQAVTSSYPVSCRVYAPVGSYSHLLAYLVRRLLENGANTSFVHQIENKNIPIEALITDPLAELGALKEKGHPHIPLPKDLYGERKNSPGINLSDFVVQTAYLPTLEKGHPLKVEQHASADDVAAALTKAANAFPAWSRLPVTVRAQYLYKAADLLIEHQAKLMGVLINEGNKTILDALSEVREAIDYCRYYAECAEKLMLNPMLLPGPTGESNTLSLHARGIAVCISPWNFPLAIFLGQIVAALVTGNTVIAKPASQTPQIATYAVQLLHKAGIPKEVLQLAIGKSSVIGDVLMKDPRVAIVNFTGSTHTAQHINRTLAERDAPLAALIAETGGLNAMIVDSSALLEQVVSDVVMSAFNSAGQRCSALRVLCIQEDIYEPLIAMLKGAMAELTIGDPHLLSTDVGPVIDANAQSELLTYLQNVDVLYQVPQPTSLQGHFVMPTLVEIKDIHSLTKEVFGPILHVISYKRQALDQLLDGLNTNLYGLTLGIHSRIQSFTEEIIEKTYVGNNYVNRNMIGAVVGVQPFGGQRLSGTGPKAGGPHYLLRMVTEKTVSINTAALGGDTALLSLNAESIPSSALKSN